MVIATSASSATTTIALPGVQWMTFRSLMAESEANYGYKIFYSTGMLQIEYDRFNSSLAEGTLLFSGIQWHSIYAALGVPELWRYRQHQLEVYDFI